MKSLEEVLRFTTQGLGQGREVIAGPTNVVELSSELVDRRRAVAIPPE